MYTSDESLLIYLSNILILPDVVESIVPIKFKNVVFPPPEGPLIITN